MKARDNTMYQQGDYHMNIHLENTKDLREEQLLIKKEQRRARIEAHSKKAMLESMR